MKVLYFGGQKSGKTSAAISKTLALAKNRPYYIATYDNSFHDKEMQERVSRHQDERQNSFITIEEPKDLLWVIQPNQTYMIDCISMWILNNMELSQEALIEQLEAVLDSDATVVFVLNDVTRGVIPMDQLSRRFVDLTGVLGQCLAKRCDEVYRVEFSIVSQIK